MGRYIAVPKLCRCAQEAPIVVRHEATALAEAFIEFGFRLSFGEHKTAALVSVCGQRSRAAEKHLFGAGGLKGQVPVLLEHLPAMNLPLPPKYKHLGVQQMPAGGIWEELRYRVSQARSAFAEARRKIFGSRAIPLRRKALLLNSNVLSKLLLGAGAWPPLRHREYRLFAGTIWGLYRSVLGVKFQEDQHITSSTCYALLQLPDPDVTLRTSRLSYVAQLLRAGPAPLWAAIRADTQYIDMLRQDFAWLYSWCHATTDWPNPDTHWAFWKSAIVKMPGRYKGLCKRARVLTVLQHTVRAAFDGLYRAIRAVAGSTEPVCRPTTESSLQMCVPCRRSFPSLVSWSGHAARKHGYRSKAHLTAVDRICRGCGKAYASQHRLRRHLVTSRRCLAGWGAFTPTQAALDSTSHPLAPPGAVEREWTSPPLLDTVSGISQPLREALEALDGCFEDEVFETVESFIEPLAILRATVAQWAADFTHSPWHAQVSENILLLLDPTVLAESAQELADNVPSWPPLGRIPLVESSTRCSWFLRAPPPHRVPPHGVFSMSVKAACAYATWVEAATDVLGRCVAQAPELESALGPAVPWLLGAGFELNEGGLYS